DRSRPSPPVAAPATPAGGGAPRHDWNRSEASWALEREAPAQERFAAFRLRSLFLRHIVPSPGADVHLARARDLLLGIEKHLFPLRNPPRRSWNRKEDGKHLNREAHGLIDES